MVNLLNFLNTSFYMNPVTPTLPDVKFNFLKKKQNLLKKLKKLKRVGVTNYDNQNLPNNLLACNSKNRFNYFKDRRTELIKAKKRTFLPKPPTQKLFLTYLALNYGERQTSFGVEQLLQSSLNENFPFYKNFDIKKQFFYFYEIPIPDDLENQSFAVQKFFNTLPFNKVKYTPFIVSEQNHKFFKTYYKDNFVKNFNKKLFSSYNTLIYFFNFISGLYFFKKKIMFLEYKDLLVNFNKQFYFDEDNTILAPVEITYDFNFSTKPADDDIISHALEGVVFLKNLYLLPKKLKSVKKDNYFAKLNFIKKKFIKPIYYKSYFLRKFKMLKSKKQFKFGAKIKNFQKRIKILLSYTNNSKIKQKLTKIQNPQNLNFELDSKIESSYFEGFDLEQLIIQLRSTLGSRHPEYPELESLVEKYYFYNYYFNNNSTIGANNFTAFKIGAKLFALKNVVKFFRGWEPNSKPENFLKFDFSDDNFLREHFLIQFELKNKISLLKKTGKDFKVLKICQTLLVETKSKIHDFLESIIKNSKNVTPEQLFKRFIAVEPNFIPAIALNYKVKPIYKNLFNIIKIKNKYIKYIFVKKTYQKLAQIHQNFLNKRSESDEVEKAEQLRTAKLPIKPLTFKFKKLNKKLNFSKFAKYLPEHLGDDFFSVRFYKDLDYLSKFNQFNTINYNNLLFSSYFSRIADTNSTATQPTKLIRYYFKNRIRFFNFVKNFKAHLTENLTTNLAYSSNRKNNFFYLIKKSLRKFIKLYNVNPTNHDILDTGFIAKPTNLNNFSLFSNFKKSKIYFTDYFNTPLLADNVNVKVKNVISDNDKYLLYDLQNVLDKLEFFNETYIKLVFAKGSDLPFNKKKIIGFVEKKMAKLDCYREYFNIKNFYKDENFKKIMIQFRYLFQLYKTLYNFLIIKPYSFSFVRKLIIVSRRLKKKSFFNKFKYFNFIRIYSKLIKVIIRSKMFVRHTFYNYMQSYYYLKVNKLIDETLLFKMGTFELDESRLSDRQYVLDNAEDIMLTLNDVYSIGKQKSLLATVPSLYYYELPLITESYV